MCCEKVAIHVFFMASYANKLKNAKKKTTTKPIMIIDTISVTISKCWP